MRSDVKKKLPLFYKIYFCVVAVLLIACVIGVWWLNGFLADYEAAQPKRVADGIFEKYYKSGDFSLLASRCSEDNPFESAEAVRAYLTEHYAGADMVCTSGASKGGAPTYIVKVGEYKISSFTLKESEKKTARGWEMYEEGDFEVYYDTEKLTLIAPTGYSASVNGIALGDSYAAEKGISGPEAPLLPEGIEGVKYVRYELEGLIVDPDIAVVSPEGRSVPVSYEEKDAAYHAYPLFDEALEAEQKEYVLGAITRYALMMMNDEYWGNVEKYFDPESAIYLDAQDVSKYTWFQIDHDTHAVEDETVSQFLRYSDDVFTCRVKFTVVLTKGTQTFRDFFDSTVIWRNVGGTWKICGMINNA